MNRPGAWSRVPTLAPILEGAVRGLRRMPLTVLAGAVATVAAIMLNENLGDEQRVAAVLWSAVLGIPLLAGLRLLAERYDWPAPSGWVLDVAGALLLVAFGLAWSGWSETVQAARLMQAVVVAVLFVAVAPYLTGPENPGFWAHNRALLERVLVAAFFAHVLYVGAAIALAALENLFDVDIASRAYLRLWLVAVLFLTPWLFVAGLPSRADADPDYPRGLRVFTRFVLLPIVALYLLILLAYFVKVLVTWEWPSGWIGWLVSVVAVAGIFSLLLVHPLSSRPGDRWVGTYARAFYLALLPAIVMLWVAIWQRVRQYGITENRYFLIVLSVWLAGIAVYQLATRARGIRIIPVSLAVLGLVTFAGPWGAYAFSEGSQVRRLAALLTRNGMLADGRVTPATGDVPAEDRREISAVLRYLIETHDLSAVSSWFDGRLASIDTLVPDTPGWRRADERARLISDWLGVPYVTAWQGARTQWFSYAADPGSSALAAAPYDTVLFVRQGAAAPGAGLQAVAASRSRAVAVYRDGVLLGRLSLDSLFAALRDEPRGPERRGDLPAPRLRVTGEAADLRLTLQLLSVSGQWTDDSLAVTELQGVLLVGKR